MLRSLTPEAALRAAQAALQSCARTGYQVGGAVSDRAGHSLVMLRDRLAGPHTPETALNKAYAAVTFKMDTLAFARATQATEVSSGIGVHLISVQKVTVRASPQSEDWRGVCSRGERKCLSRFEFLLV
ncbi:GlcG/HbpS family heme-binding protein, partial [Ramlibacter albus]|uniref:GlcG/HbpS family heme-binding protein n=1 Tax=Ramlibacter albus TaxID=2079448 RepID=UPI00339056F4